MSAIDELRPASFRGVPFQVDQEQVEQSRSVPVHEFAGTDTWLTEDHGLKAAKYKVTAYVANMDGLQAESYALWGACSTGDPAELVLPHALPALCRCTSISRSHGRDRLGYAAFSLDFVAEPDAAFGLSALLLPSQAASAFVALGSALVGMLSTLILSHPRARAAYEVEAAELVRALDVRMATVTDPEVRAAWLADRVDPETVDATDPDEAATIVDSFVGAVEALRVSADPEAIPLLVDAAAALSVADLAVAPVRAPVASVSPAASAILIPPASPLPAAPRAASRRLALLATETVRTALRALAAAALARRLMVATYPTRDEANAARQALAGLIEPILDGAPLDEPAFRALADLHGLASGHLIDTATSLKPIVRVSTPKPLTASLLAWQLYGDTARAGELVARNRVATPCFMPTTFEAVAP